VLYGSHNLNHAICSYYQVMEKLVEIVHCLHVEIQDAFGPCGIAFFLIFVIYVFNIVITCYSVNKFLWYI
jgi:hypothetical protein